MGSRVDFLSSMSACFLHVKRIFCVTIFESSFKTLHLAMTSDGLSKFVHINAIMHDARKISIQNKSPRQERWVQSDLMHVHLEETKSSCEPV